MNLQSASPAIHDSSVEHFIVDWTAVNKHLAKEWTTMDVVSLALNPARVKLKLHNIWKGAAITTKKCLHESKWYLNI